MFNAVRIFFTEYLVFMSLSGADPGGGPRGLIPPPPLNLTSKVLMRTQFLLLFYLRYNQSLLSCISFISFFNYYLKMVILIVYLTLN